MKETNKGFTLIELLVVIAIIGMLSSVVLASLNSARAKARDVKRLSDIRQVQNALELYRNDNQRYPPVANDNADPSCACSSSCTAATRFCNLVNDLVTPGYLSSISSDPIEGNDNQGYRYSTNSTGNGYTIIVHLERNATWCSINNAPGVNSWNGTNDPLQYPAC